MTSTPAPFRLSHFGLCVSDLERSLRFYREGLGFDVAERYELGVPLVFLHDPDGVRIELMQVPARPPREG